MVMAAAAGLLAASIVVFAPLAMAGWHITRNRVLFFSTILFILLAATVHVLPYAPSLSHIVSLLVSPPRHQSSCLHSLYSIDFSRDDDLPKDDNDDDDDLRWSWTNNSCKLREISREEALEFLTGTWIVVAGDSQARFFLLALLQLLLETSDSETIKSKLFKFHSDFDYAIDERRLKVDFVWAPYAANLTSFMRELDHHNGSYPDVMVMGAGLWDMLHVSDPLDYGESLERLLAAANESTAAARSLSHLFWMNLPVLVPRLLNTEAKRLTMTASLLSRYENEFEKSNLTFPSGPFRILDVNRLTSSCGEECTSDGMHYDSAVYAAVVQIMLQTLVLTRS